MYVGKTPNSKYYQIVYFIDGKRKTKSTKTTSKKEAQKFLANFNPNTPPIIEVKPKDIRLKTFYKEYLQHLELSKSKPYLKSVRLSFTQFLDFTGDILLNQITIRIIDSFISTTFKRAEYSAALYYRTLKAAFSTAENWEYIQTNPFKKIKAPKTQNKLPVYISKDDLNTIIENTKEDYLKNLFTFAFHTGMRLAEILNMKWSWIDIKHKSIIIKNDDSFTTKSKADRVIPMNDTTINILTAQRTNIHLENDFIFYRLLGIKLNECFISKQFKKSARKAKLNEAIHFHTLRHSFASRLVQQSVPLYFIKELLGHSSITTTEIYSHVKKEELSNAVNLL